MLNRFGSLLKPAHDPRVQIIKRKTRAVRTRDGNTGFTVESHMSMYLGNYAAPPISRLSSRSAARRDTPPLAFYTKVSYSSSSQTTPCAGRGSSRSVTTRSS